jgi:hypothetical protein
MPAKIYHSIILRNPPKEKVCARREAEAFAGLIPDDPTCSRARAKLKTLKTKTD